MAKKIKFIAVNEWAWDLADKPYPAKNNIPKWWRDMPPYIKNEENPTGKKFILNNLRNNLSPKKCVSLLDSITEGYIIPLWADVQVTNRPTEDGEYNPIFTWKTTREVLEYNIDGDNHLKAPDGYNKHVFKFINMWCIRTPPGYSTRISSAIGHNDLPFKPFDAVVDTDKYDAALPIPFHLKEGFEGLLKRGTPIVKVTPFKREDWKAEFDYYPGDVHSRKQESWLRLTSFGNYVKNQWSKKNYD
jgi:hypothetical protein